MGIDIHALNFIAYAASKQPLGRVATIGRQGLLVPGLIAEFGYHCEPLLINRFAAALVESYDYSDYEGATDIVDLNQPIQITKQYNTVIDCGCIEHIYNVPQALKSISMLCENGGQIIHVLPGNNFCGHGFWQFSPELFFSLYSPENGYADTEVFLAKVRSRSVWYKVRQPVHGERAEALSSSPLHVMCRTTKASNFSHDHVQQSDYVYTWNQAPSVGQRSSRIPPAMKDAIKMVPWLFSLALSVRGFWKTVSRRWKTPIGLSGRNPHLWKCRVVDLLGSNRLSGEE